MTTKLLLIGLFVFCMIIMSLNHGKKKKKIVFLGDAINDMDLRAGGFLSYLVNCIREEGLEERYQVAHSIKPGEKVYDLYMRLDENLHLKEAQIVIVHIGLNDVLDKYLKGTGTDIETFKHVLQAIINKLKAAHLRVILCIPDATINAAFSEVMLNEFLAYADLIKTLSEENHIPFIDLDKTFEYSHYPENANEQKGNLNGGIGREIWKVVRELK